MGGTLTRPFTKIAKRVAQVHQRAQLAAFGLSVAWCASAHAEPVRILVAAGHKLGLAAEHPLKYADVDATRVRDIMVGFGGVKPEHAFVLTEPSRTDLFAAFARARGEAEKHKADEVTLVFYFSGHGDRQALHLGDDRVLLSDIEAKLGEVPAALRIAITDACRTTREKGFIADEPFAISATTSTQATGQVWLHASSDGEAAQESDELRGALFTHAWLNGLRGAADANGDARVTLDESFAFAYSQTLIRSAKSSGVVQKPEAIVNLHELAPVVLTQTAPRMAMLSLPVARDTHFLVYSAGTKSVLSELWGSPNRRIALAVPPGGYVIEKHLGSTGGTAQIALAAGEERKLDERDFAASSLEAVAMKGEADQTAAAPPPRAKHEISAGYEAGADARTGLVQGPRATYAFAWNRVALSIGGGADFSGRTLPDTTEHLATAFGRASLEVRVPLGATMLRLGGGGRAGWLWQTLEPAGTVASSAPHATKTTNGAFVLGPEAFVAFRVDLGPLLYGEIDARGAVSFLREEGSTHGIPSLVGGGALGARF
jgi:hypothetical protein